MVFQTKMTHQIIRKNILVGHITMNIYNLNEEILLAFSDRRKVTGEVRVIVAKLRSVLCGPLSILWKYPEGSQTLLCLTM